MTVLDLQQQTVARSKIALTRSTSGICRRCLLSSADSAEGCEALAAQLAAGGGPAVNIFTWHDETQGPFANHCIGRTDGLWSPHGPGPGHGQGS